MAQYKTVFHTLAKKFFRHEIDRCKCDYDSGVGRTLFISDFSLHSMREILNWIRINLFSHEILNDYLTLKMTEPIVNPQLALF